jgi:beta-barrel assembly-enhancing protease
LEAELGRSAAAESLGTHSVCSAPAVNAAIDEIGGRLVDGLSTNPYEFHFLVVDDPQMNAFALPAGYVFVNFGLIEAADSPDQVAGVLAHEIQHAMRRHGLRNVIARLGLTLIVGLAVGDVQGMGGIVGSMAAEMAGLSFSRDQEEEADRLGLELLYAANFDPDGLPAFFDKLKDKEKELGMALPSFLSTHPDTDSRVAGLRAVIKAQGKAQVTPIATDWDKAKAECRPIPWADPDKKVEEQQTPTAPQAPEEPQSPPA